MSAMIVDGIRLTERERLLTLIELEHETIAGDAQIENIEFVSCLKPRDVVTLEDEQA